MESSEGMSRAGKKFEDLEERLEELYAKVDCLMADNKEVSLIKAKIASANSVCAEMERIALREVDEERKKFLLDSLKQHHAYRASFDERVSTYLTGKMSEKDIFGAVSAPPTLRSRASVDIGSTKSSSLKSSVLKTKLVVKEELAKLKLKHLEEKQRLEREVKRQEEERRFSLELLQARQSLEEVSLERQVVEEELERGGYLSSEVEKRPTFQEPPIKSDLPMQNFRVLTAENRLAGRVEETIPKYVHPINEQPKTQLSLAEPREPFYERVVSRERDVPKIEILKFSGDPTNYIRFIKTFEANVECVIKDLNRCLLLLIQHCEGEPRKLIEFCLMLDPQRGYWHAKSILKDNYGRKNQIARAFIDKLHSDVIISTDNESDLVNLARDLEECELTFRQLNLHSDINNFEAIGKVVKRLPYALQNRWVRTAAEIERTGEEPTIVDLVKYVKGEAEIAKSSYARFVSQKPKRFKRMSTHATGVDEKFIKAKKCYLCFRNHYLRDCFEFRRKPLDEKIAFMRKNRLCDFCFKQGHIARFCRNEGSCSVVGCRRKHHRLFHREQNPSDVSEDSSSASANGPSTVGMTSNSLSESKSSPVFLNVVPVRVHAGEITIETLAFLDQGSTTTLCDARLLEDLGVRGEDATYSITTVNQTSEQRNGKKAKLLISSLVSNETVRLENVYCVGDLPIQSNPKLSSDHLRRWPHLQGIELPSVKNRKVQLLIGVDNPEVFWTIDERHGRRGEPFAVKTILGWSLIGGTKVHFNRNLNVNFVKRADELLQKQVDCFWKLDNVPNLSCLGVGMSRNDRYAMKRLEETKQHKNGHYQVGLLWRPGAPNLKNNYQQAVQRLQTLKRRMLKNDEFRSMYASEIESYISNGYARPLTNQEKCSNNVDCWYLPHHAVFHPRKANKVRVVFDCAARQNGTSLNEQLLPGPDLLNNLIGVLSRFRMGEVGLVADIKAMYHQVFVDPKDQKYLRFLWWPNGDLSCSPVEYCMKVHVFGATSSPTCANYALRETANDNVSLYSNEVVQTVLSNFYMDDCLKSVNSVDEAVNLSVQLTRLLRKGGFYLTKWLSNRKEVLTKISEEERSKVVLDLTKIGDEVQRVLGVAWNFENDCFQFSVNMQEKPLTRRGILSVVSSLFDPLGFAAPVVLKAKLILQNLCRLGLGWDEPIPNDSVDAWNKWFVELPQIRCLQINRCFLGPVSSEKVQLHFFADASERAYGVVAYLRVCYTGGKVGCKFVIGKSRLAPIKSTSIPRLELEAATLAAKLSKMMSLELNAPNWKTFFWTDSMTVLYMIRNSSKRFPTFVANRLAKIDELTEPNQWRYVNSNLNPADDASRGVEGSKLKQDSRWVNGPEFLKYSEDKWPVTPCNLPALPQEFSILRNQVHNTSTNELKKPPSVMCNLFLRFSSWYKLKRATAWLLKFKDYVLKKNVANFLTVSDLERAERAIICCVQQDVFEKEVKAVHCNKTVSLNSLRKLNPQLYEGILCVGGRLHQAELPFSAKHPIILPSHHHVTKLIVQDHHESVGHSGMSHTWSSLRQKFWVLKGAGTVRKVLGQCLKCKRRNAPAGQQFMSELPKCRLTPNKPPFYFTGVDYFGPFTVKQGRSKVKRWGCIFTCLTTRAVHMEVAATLSTDSFINALRRFIGRRGKPLEMYSDNGTNFVGAERELREALQKFNSSVIRKNLLQRNIQWHFNPPYASNMGGVWERLIRSVRRILRNLLEQQTTSDDGLLTLMVEIESILNSRPLTPVTIDPEADVPLTPNHLLLLRESPNLPPGLFSHNDNYSTKRWRQIQYLSQQFWSRWSREYIQTLQIRSKWQKIKNNFNIDDIVLVYDENSPRGKWPLGRIVQIFPDRRKHVRQVLVKTVTSTIRRPITKLFKIVDAVY